MTYVKQEWEDFDPLTPISGERLAHMEQGIADAMSSSGDTMSGPLDMSNNSLHNVADPVNPQDAATRAYVLTQITEVAGAEANAQPTQPSLRSLGFGAFEAAPGDQLLAALLRLQTVEALLGMFVIDGGDPTGELAVTTSDGGDPDSSADSVVDGGIPDLVSSVDGGTP